MTPSSEHVQVRWDLLSLPSAQHRAGLAGLLLMMRFWERQPDRKGICKVDDLSATHLTATFDEVGLSELMDLVYSAYEDRDTDKESAKKPLPTGGPLPEWDVHPKFGYHRLWQSLVWKIRVPKTRNPFIQRAQGLPSGKGPEAWDLVRNNKPKSLAGHLFLGAEASTSEGADCKEPGRLRWLGEFQLFVAQVYEMPDHDLVVAVPDVLDLEGFCREFPLMMRGRSADIAGWRPAAAIIDLPSEAGVDFTGSMRSWVARSEGVKATSDLLLGCEVFRIRQSGKKAYTVRSRARVAVDPRFEGHRLWIREVFKDPLFRKQLLDNAFHDRLWSSGLDLLFGTETLNSPSFRADARRAVQVYAGESMTNPRPLEQLVRSVCRTYVDYHIAKTRPRLTYRSLVATHPDHKGPEWLERSRLVEKIARKALFTIRAEVDLGTFPEFFAGTLCVRGTFLTEQELAMLSAVLESDCKHLRVLTMLNLAAAT